jgi:hypothetical protein
MSAKDIADSGIVPQNHEKHEFGSFRTTGTTGSCPESHRPRQ